MTVLRLAHALLSAFAIFTASQCFAACIDDQKSGSDATINQDAVGEIADVRQEVDTGGLTCGKCVRTHHVDRDEANRLCLFEDATGDACCPAAGDLGCDPMQARYLWAECTDVVEVFGLIGCADADAYTNSGLSPTGARCALQEIACIGTRPEPL